MLELEIEVECFSIKMEQIRFFCKRHSRGDEERKLQFGCLDRETKSQPLRHTPATWLYLQLY